MIKLALLAISLLFFQTLSAEIAHTSFDWVDYGNTPLYMVMELPDGKYVSLMGKTSRVFTLNGSDIDFEQTVHSDESYHSVRQGADNTFYAISLYGTLDVYKYEPTQGLSLLSSLELRSPGADLSLASVSLCFEAASGTIIYESWEETFGGNGWCSRNMVDVRNPSQPVLLERTQIELDQRYSGFFFIDGLYIYIGGDGTVYSSEAPTANPAYVASVSQDQVNIHFSKLIDGSIYYIYSNAQAEYYLARLDLIDAASVNITTLHSTNIRRNFDMMIDGAGMACVYGENASGVWQIERYISTASNDWQPHDVASFDNEMYQLFDTADGYFAPGFYKSMLLGSNLNPLAIINESSGYLLYTMVKGRYLVLSEYTTYTAGSVGFRIFDLDAEEFLDFRFTGNLEKNYSVHDVDKLVFISQNIEVVEFGDNGISNVWTMPRPAGIIGGAVYGDILALSGYIDEEWRIYLYSISGSGLVFQSQNVLPHICASLDFYAPKHIRADRYTDDGKIMYFYRIEADYSLSFISEITSSGTHSLIVGDRMVQANDGGAVIDISNPNQPTAVQQLSLLTYGGWGGSSDGQGNIIIRDFYHSFVLDSDLQVLGYLLGINTWFYQPGKFLNPGPTGVVKAKIHGLGSPNADIEAYHGAFKIYTYPNPFKGFTNIKVNLDEVENASITIYNIKGQKVKNIALDDGKTGEQFTYWDGRDADNRQCSSGIYLLNLMVNGRKVSSKKVTLVR